MKKVLVYASFIMMLIGMQVGRRTGGEHTPVATTVEIRTQVEAYMESHETKPHEPRHDPVWQFVPGLQGITFDFELSYQNMLSNGQFDASLMVGQAIPYEGNREAFRQHRIYRGHEQSPYIGLLINVAWGAKELTQMLDILAEHQIHASIFFEGKFAHDHHDLVLDVFNRGHLVGNHSYSHPADWLTLSYEGFQTEIVRTNDILTNIIGEDILYFAPPGGAFTDETVQAAYDQGMYTILWTADSIDWRGEPANILIERVMHRIVPGGLILTHPKPETVIALPTLIEKLRQQGYEFRRIDEIVSGERTGFFEN
ncbi:MAG: polysaccharide deacetylase family protein [Defluviitaleaceae bacterium]|nr:polysaccharide deacetylase family protein [Defluviitaleaceae bacterium]